jgi:hypothetical protein
MATVDEGDPFEFPAQSRPASIRPMEENATTDQENSLRERIAELEIERDQLTVQMNQLTLQTNQYKEKLANEKIRADTADADAVKYRQAANAMYDLKDFMIAHPLDLQGPTPLDTTANVLNNFRTGSRQWYDKASIYLDFATRVLKPTITSRAGNERADVTEIAKELITRFEQVPRLLDMEKRITQFVNDITTDVYQIDPPQWSARGLKRQKIDHDENRDVEQREIAPDHTVVSGKEPAAP